VSSASRIPVFLLTGFLGSGKTTLLNAALREPALANTAVVVNELGAIGLDHLIVTRAADNVVLLDAGCLCCVNTGALHETLADLAGRRARAEVPPFERVIVETSGAADPAPLLNVLLGHPLVTASYALEATVCAADAQHFLAARREHAELDKQAAFAERIVLTKTDLAEPGALRALLAELNPDAEIFVSTPQAPATGVFAPCVRRRRPGAGIAALGPIRPHGRPSGIRAFAYRPPEPVTWAGWAAWSQHVSARFGARLLRVKGLLRMTETGEIVLVQGVQGVFHRPERFSDWPDADRGNRLVCIARDLDPAEIEATLALLATAPGTPADSSLADLKERQTTR
jgi:G3E family GTPase